MSRLLNQIEFQQSIDFEDGESFLREVKDSLKYLISAGKYGSVLHFAKQAIEQDQVKFFAEAVSSAIIPASFISLLDEDSGYKIEASAIKKDYTLKLAICEAKKDISYVSLATWYIGLCNSKYFNEFVKVVFQTLEEDEIESYIEAFESKDGLSSLL